MKDKCLRMMRRAELGSYPQVDSLIQPGERSRGSTCFRPLSSPRRSRVSLGSARPWPTATLPYSPLILFPACMSFPLTRPAQYP
jgi:hypothetical protein